MTTGRKLAFNTRFRSSILRENNEESKGADAGKAVSLMVQETHRKSN